MMKMLGPIGVDVSPSYLVPDLVAVETTRLTSRSWPLPPEWVSLAIEIVSPGSRSMDRLVKPDKYARIGIPNFWRVEVDPVITLTAYELDGGSYREMGTWGPGETAQLQRPYPVTIPMDDIPRPA